MGVLLLCFLFCCFVALSTGESGNDDREAEHRYVVGWDFVNFTDCRLSEEMKQFWLQSNGCRDDLCIFGRGLNYGLHVEMALKMNISGGVEILTSAIPVSGGDTLLLNRQLRIGTLDARVLYAFSSSPTWNMPLGEYRIRWKVGSLTGPAKEYVACTHPATVVNSLVGTHCDVPNTPCTVEFTYRNERNSNCYAVERKSEGDKTRNVCDCDTASVNVDGECKKTAGTFCKGDLECVQGTSCKNLSDSVIQVCSCNSGSWWNEESNVCSSKGSRGVSATAAVLTLMTFVCGIWYL